MVTSIQDCIWAWANVGFGGEVFLRCHGIWMDWSMDWRTDLTDFDGMCRMCRICIDVLSLEAGPSGSTAGTGGLMLSKGTQLHANLISPALFHRKDGKRSNRSESIPTAKHHHHALRFRPSWENLSTRPTHQWLCECVWHRSFVEKLDSEVTEEKGRQG